MMQNGAFFLGKTNVLQRSVWVRLFQQLAFCITFLLGILMMTNSVEAAQATGTRVLMKTNLGEIELVLDAQKAPKTVANFVQYVKDGFYDGTIFHRVIKGFMIQGGGFTPDMKQKTNRAPIELESKNGLKNTRGTIAMARTGVPNSATSQFFINVVDNAMLDYPKPDGFGYAVFGRVTKGLDVVDKIKAVATGNHPAGHADVPQQAVIIEKVTVLSE